MTTINGLYKPARICTDMPQLNALLSDLFIFVTGGFHLAVSVGWSYIAYNLHFKICWFIGVAIGCVLAPLLINWKRRRLFIFSPIVLVNASAIVAISGYFDMNALIGSRYLNGIAIGLNTVSFIVHGSEITSEYHRGFCLSLEQVGLVGGAYIQTIYTAVWRDDFAFSTYCLQGIFCLIFGIIAFLLTYIAIDSPVVHLCRGDEPEALNCVVRLYRPTIMSNRKKEIFNKIKEYVSMNESMPPHLSFLCGLSPLVRLVIYRCMLSFIVGSPITQSLKWCTTVLELNANVNWPPLMYSFLGVFGVVVGTTFMGTIGRKAVSLFSLFFAAFLTIGVGIVFHNPNWSNEGGKMSIVCGLLMIARIFGGMFAPSTTVYLGEAFPLKWKRCFIALTVIVQYMIDLIIVCTFEFNSYNVYVFFLTAGVLMLFGVILFSLTIPETRNTTLKEAQKQFSHFLNLDFH